MRNILRLRFKKWHHTAKFFSHYTPPNFKYDVVIVGGGIVGLATARELQLRYPKFKCAIIEKEKELSIHQSKNNSGVIHAGIYYAPGSLKAKLCVEGMKLSYDYLSQKNIPFKQCGKLIVAVNHIDLTRLENLWNRGLKNNVPGLHKVNASEIKEIEPNCAGLSAIYSEKTGIVDWRAVALSFGDDFISGNGDIFTNYEAKSFDESQDPDYPILIHRTDGTDPEYIKCKYAITCAGLQSDRVAYMSGCSTDPKIIPFRGDYLRLCEDKSDLVKVNIYPVPDPRFPFLGVHFTPRIDGSVWLGPNAILSLDREGYGKFDINFKDAMDSLCYPGFIKLAKKYVGFGINEMISNVFISRQVKQLQKFVPTLQNSDVIRGPSGIRAQAINGNGDLVDDFVIDYVRGGIGKFVMHVRNAPSPAATSSLSIARLLADKATESFNLPSPQPRSHV